MENKYTSSGSSSMSGSIEHYALAFIKAKKQFTATGKHGRNEHQKYSYAKIEDIYSAVEPALMDNNIFIVHFAKIIDDKELLATRLIHAPSGQFVEDLRVLRCEKPGNQAMGAANTYMKKYAVLSLCAIATEDDDGQEEERYIESRPIADLLITEAQVNILKSEIKKTEKSKQTTLYAHLLSSYKIGDFKQLKSDCFAQVMAYIDANKE